MINTVVVFPEFKKNIKPLAKKYNSLRHSVEELHSVLIQNPYLGVSYGSGMFKVRLADKSKGTGESGGFRVLNHHLEKTSEGVTILLTNIYDKSDISTIIKTDAVSQLRDSIKEYRSKL